MSTSATNTQFEEEYSEIAPFCKMDDWPISTVHRYIRRGDIALHQFMGERRPKIRVAEARQVLAKIKRRYTGPDLRIIRHDGDAALPIVERKKVDLFA